MKSEIQGLANDALHILNLCQDISKDEYNRKGLCRRIERICSISMAMATDAKTLLHSLNMQGESD
jgi:hypothetical protein